MRSKLIYGLLILAMAFAACRKPFSPDVISSSNSYLVVEGVINSANDSTIIKLSKTVKIGNNTRANTLNRCTVTVEDEQGGSQTLQGKGNGKYISPALTIDGTKKYRLHVITPDSKEYASDYVVVKANPPIDDIAHDIPTNTLDTGVQIYVSTHDPSNNTRYYRWDYVENWRIMSYFESFFVIDGNTIRERTPLEQINVCYASDTSTNIYLGSSAKLTNDVINRSPIALVSQGTAKLKYRYSIKMRQYAITKEEYQFWENMQKNNEQLGSIFDAQPSQLTGNIHNVKDATEPVIGYVSVTNIQTKRIFISPAVVPTNGVTGYPFPNCKIDSVFYNPAQPYGPPGCFYACIVPNGDIITVLINGGGKNVPILPIPVPMAPYIAGWKYSTIECADCRLRGSNTPPPDWVN